ncbi:MAG: FAD-dependent thymidylate synthase [SAR202 cluster bacterium]|nr:FAD-dependent thymidylate synthase [SAR202 cluster bacterium]
MKLITEPSVYLVSRPSVDWEQVATFLSDEGVPGIPESIRAGDDESAAIVEVSARMCYMSYGRGRKDIADFINNLLASKDGSVLEHVNYGFVVTGVSRSLTHELVRHRAGFAFSQRSQRYVDETEGAFVVPPALADGIGDTEEANRILRSAMESAATSYAGLVASLEDALPEERFTARTDRRKAIRQAARAVLPNATETKIFVTANVRAWRHFIEMRGTPFADWEIRRLALIILRILQKESPLLFGDFTIGKLPDGTETAKPVHSKV